MTSEAAEWFAQTSNNSTPNPNPRPALNLGMVLGERAPLMVQNVAKSINENRLRLTQIIARKK